MMYAIAFDMLITDLKEHYGEDWSDFTDIVKKS